MLAEQVVQEVAAGRRLGDQMMVVELIELTAGGWHVDVVEGRRGVGVDIWAGGQAEPAEQPLLLRGEIGVRQVERSSDRQVLSAHDGQPVAGRRQTGGHLGTDPCWVMPELRGEHPDRQRKVSAQPCYLTSRACSGAQFGTAGQPGQQHRRLIRGQGVDADRRGVLERSHPPAAGDQNQAATGARQQRTDLIMPGRVIEQQQDPLARDVVTPPVRAGLQAGRDVLHSDASRQQQASQRISRADRRLTRGVGVQRKEELPVREPPGQPVRGVHREGGLADPRHPVDRIDLHWPTAPGHIGQQPRELRFAAGKAANITRQAPRRRSRRCPGRRAVPGRQHLRGLRPPARRRDEQHPHLAGQAQRISQQQGGVLAGAAVDTPLQVTD